MAKKTKTTTGATENKYLSSELTRELFVAEYLVDLNAMNAAIRAGIGNTPGSSGVAGHRLLKEPKVQAEITKKFAERLERIELTQDKVVQELAIVALSDILNYEVNRATGRLVPLGNRRISKAVQSIKIKTDAYGNSTTEIKLWDKIRAIELLMRHMGMLSNEDVEAKERLTANERRDRAAAGLARLLEQRRASAN